MLWGQQVFQPFFQPVTNQTLQSFEDNKIYKKTFESTALGKVENTSN